MAIEWTESTRFEMHCRHLYHPTYATNNSLNASYYCLAEHTLTLEFVHNKSVTFHVKDQEHAERIIEAIENKNH